MRFPLFLALILAASTAGADECRLCEKTPTLAECPTGKCAKSASVVEGPQHSILAHKPLRRAAALPAKAIAHTAKAVCQRRPARRLLKAVARVAVAPAKAVGRARFRCCR